MSRVSTRLAPCRRSRRSLSFAAAAALLLPAALTGQNPNLSRWLDEVTRDVDSNAKLAQVMVDKVFSFSELGSRRPRRPPT